MLNNKKYDKNIKERKFNIFYWSIATILTIFYIIFQNILKSKEFILFSALFLFIIIYFATDYFKTIKHTNKVKVFKQHLILHAEEARKQQLNYLIVSLKLYRFSTKNDLKLAIDYFNSQKPIKVASSFLAWIVSASLTLASFAEIAYDNESKSIDYTKISVILNSTLGIIIISLIIKAIVKFSYFSQESIQSALADDLTYIYMNFDKYKNQLTKNKNEDS